MFTQGGNKDDSDDQPLKSSLKSMRQVDPSLLVAPQVKFIETTQRSKHYASTNRAKKDADKEPLESVARRLGALST